MTVPLHQNARARLGLRRRTIPSFVLRSETARGPLVVVNRATDSDQKFDWQRATDTKISLSDFTSLMRPWKSKKGINMILVMIFYSMAYIGLLAMTPLYIQDDLGYSTVFSGFTFAIMMITGGLTAPLIGRVSDRFNRKVVNVIALLVGVIGLTFLTFSTLTVLIVAGASIAAGAWTGLRPSLLADAVEITGKRESTSLGIIFVFMDGIGALGAVLAGIVGYADLRYAFLFSGILALIAMCCLCFNIFSMDRFLKKGS